MNVIGVPCPICGQKFASGDDIVVCPDCGAPYHRACYKEKGRCIMDELHERGAEWENPLELAQKAVLQATVLPCPDCGHPNHCDNLRCESCGYHLKQADPAPKQVQNDYLPPERYQSGHPEDGSDPFADVFGPINPKAQINSILIGDIMGFVQKNCHYFVRLFKLKAKDIGAVVFNWSALFFGPFYFFYRKMHRRGFVLLMLELASYLPSFALAYHLMPQAIADPSLMQSMQFNVSGMDGLMAIVNICGYIPLLLHIYAGFTANGSYYEHTMASLKRLMNTYGHDRAQMERQVLKTGGVSPLAVFLSIVGTGVAFLAVSTAIVLLLLPLV